MNICPKMSPRAGITEILNMKKAIAMEDQLSASILLVIRYLFDKGFVTINSSQNNLLATTLSATPPKHQVDKQFKT